MNLVPAQEPPLGPLFLEEVYFDHDGPRLFAARGIHNTRRFIGLCVDEDEDTTTYLYVAVRPQEFFALRAGQAGLRSLFDDAVVRQYWKVLSDFSLDPPANVIEPVALSDIDEEWLPSHEAVLFVTRAPLVTPADLVVQELKEDATTGLRSALAIELDTPDVGAFEFPLRGLGRISASLQESINALAQEEVGERTSAGVIRRSITDEVEMSVYGVRAASFVLMMGTNKSRHLVENTDLVQGALGRFTELVEAAVNEESLLTALRDYGPRARGRFRDLLGRLSEAGSGISAFSADPTGNVRKGSVSAEAVREAISSIDRVRPDSETAHLPRVLLTALNLTRRTFELFDVQRGVRYSGTFSESVRRDVDGSVVGQSEYYSATLESEVDFAATDDEGPTGRHTLVEIRRL